MSSTTQLHIGKGCALPIDIVTDTIGVLAIKGFGGVAARFYDARTGWLDDDVRDEAEGGPGPLDGTDHPSMELAWSSFETLDLTCWEEGKLRVLRTYSIDTEGAEEVVREIGKPDRLDARPSGGPS